MTDFDRAIGYILRVIDGCKTKEELEEVNDSLKIYIHAYNTAKLKELEEENGR